MRKKTECVIEVIGAAARDEGRLARATAVNLYTVHDVHPVLTAMILPAIDAVPTPGSPGTTRVRPSSASKSRSTCTPYDTN